MAQSVTTHGSAPTHGQQTHYAVPQPMPWPIMGSASLFMMVRWFGDVIRESEGGKYGRWEDVSFRWGMSFFIFSEVMFFAAFFGALFWVRVYSVPDLASIEHNALLWPGYSAHWPSAGPNFIERFSPMGAWGIPAINTLLLLSSGVTVTIAPWGLEEGNRN